MNIHNAAWNGDMNRVRTLLNQGVSLNSVNRAHNHTPLVIAAKRGHLNLVKYLVNKDASRNKNIQDALFAALGRTYFPKNKINKNIAWENHTAIIKYLINKGAKVNAKNRMGHTPLLVAVTRGRSGMNKNNINKLLDILVKAKAKNMSYLKNHPNSRERKLIDNAIERNNKRKNSRSEAILALLSFKGKHGRMDPHVAHMIASSAGY
jgi:ankyrin repeat protein